MSSWSIIFGCVYIICGYMKFKILSVCEYRRKKKKSKKTPGLNNNDNIYHDNKGQQPSTITQPT